MYADRHLKSHGQLISIPNQDNFSTIYIGRPARVWVSAILLSHFFGVQYVSPFKYSTGTPYIYTTTGFGLGKNMKMAGVDHFLVYIQTAVKYNTFFNAVFYSSLRIHQDMVYTSNCLILLGPTPVVVFIHMGSLQISFFLRSLGSRDFSFVEGCGILWMLRSCINCCKILVYKCRNQ